MTSIVAIDPGTRKSGWVLLSSDGIPAQWGWDSNEAVLGRLRLGPQICEGAYTAGLRVLIEGMTYQGRYGIGQDTLDTCVWIGQFYNEARRGSVSVEIVPRRDVLRVLCPGGNDVEVKRAVIEHYGGQEKAVGGKKCQSCKGKGWRGRGRPACLECTPVPQPILCPDRKPGCAVLHYAKLPTVGTGWEVPPGVLYGVTGHVWQAIAVAVAWKRMQEGAP